MTTQKAAAVSPAGGTGATAGGAGGELDLVALRPPWTKRLRPGHWVAIDCVIAAAFALVFVVGSTQPAYGIPTGVAYLLALVSTLPVAVRRYWPLPVLCIVLAGSVAAMSIGTGKDPSVMVALAIYIVALRLPRRTAALALVCSFSLTAAGLVAGARTVHGETAAAGASRIVASSVVIVAAWTLGLAVRQQRAYTAGLREQAERRAQAQAAEGRRALIEERLRIARELHDIVAHSMSLIAVQAGVGNYVAGARPDEAARALWSIEATSRGALRDMRRLLGVLRDDDSIEPDLQPAHGLGDLGDLISATAAAGVQVQLEVRGAQRTVPPGVDLAAYRIVQEALTNVVKHAGRASGRVVVSYQEDALAVEITDDGCGGPATAVTDGSGHGIAGMRERAGLHGGEFSAGPMPERGFRVAARLPLDSAPGEPVRDEMAPDDPRARR